MMIEIMRLGGEADAANEEAVLAILDDTALKTGRPFLPDIVNLRAQNGDGHMVGGLTGNVLQGWFFVKLLAVSPDVRGQGIGARLLAEAETIAREKALAGIYLDTFDFQAPRFYAREGYLEIGRLPAVNDTPQRIWFAKAFNQETGSET